MPIFFPLCFGTGEVSNVPSGGVFPNISELQHFGIGKCGRNHAAVRRKRRRSDIVKLLPIQHGPSRFRFDHLKSFSMKDQKSFSVWSEIRAHDSLMKFESAKLFSSRGIPKNGERVSIGQRPFAVRRQSRLDGMPRHNLDLELRLRRIDIGRVVWPDEV
ncbi:MAG: hypothetical protein U0744_21195 [Gemmataceae bacterium]